jgi:hypothetical protein
MDSESSNWSRVLSKLDKHSELLSAIVVEISTLKTGDTDAMEKYDSLENRVRNLEQKLYFGGALGFLITLIGGAIAFLLNK